MLPCPSAILFTLLGSLDTMNQIFPWDRGPITERGGSSKMMTTYMRHTKAVCLFLWTHHGSGQWTQSYLLIQPNVWH